MKQFSILLSLALMVCASLAANAGETDIAATVEAFHKHSLTAKAPQP